MQPSTRPPAAMRRGRAGPWSIGEPLGLLLRSGDLAACGHDLLLALDRHLRRRDEARDEGRGAGDFELTHQERELLLEGLADRATRLAAEIPHLPLERTDRLLARLVDELLLGVLRLPLFLRVRAHPRVHLVPEIRGELRVLVDHVLEVRREVDFARADA